MLRDLATAAWRGVPRNVGAPTVAAGSVVVIREPDPALLAAVPAAVGREVPIAVAVEGPVADGLEELLAQLPDPKGPYAIGVKAAARFLQEYPSARQIVITTPAQLLALVGLEEDRLLAPVRQALTATRDYLLQFAA